MKKKFKYTIIALAFIMFPSLIKAQEATLNNFADNMDAIIRCEYSMKLENKTDIISLYLEKSSDYYDFYWKMTINGKEANAYEKMYTMYNEQPPANTLSSIDSINYTVNNLKCPPYLAYYEKDKKYALSDKMPELQDKLYEIHNEAYDKNYCYYKFDDTNRGMFIKNNATSYQYLTPLSEDGNLPESLTGDNTTCPTYILAPLNMYKGNLDVYDYLYVFPIVEKNATLQQLGQMCKTRTISLLESKGQFYGYGSTPEEKSIYNCYIGRRVLENLNSEGKDEPEKDPNETIQAEEFNCDVLFDDETIKFISTAYFWIEIIAIVGTIVLTVKDYALSILDSNQDAMKKNNSSLVTRLIVLAIIIIMPLIIKFIFNIVKIEGINSQDPMCGVEIKK